MKKKKIVYAQFYPVRLQQTYRCVKRGSRPGTKCPEETYSFCYSASIRCFSQVIRYLTKDEVQLEPTFFQVLRMPPLFSSAMFRTKPFNVVMKTNLTSRLNTIKLVVWEIWNFPKNLGVSKGSKKLFFFVNELACINLIFL